MDALAVCKVDILRTGVSSLPDLDGSTIVRLRFVANIKRMGMGYDCRLHGPKFMRRIQGTQCDATSVGSCVREMSDRAVL